MGIVKRGVGWGRGEDYCNVYKLFRTQRQGNIGFLIKLEFLKALMVGIFRLGRI